MFTVVVKLPENDEGKERDDEEEEEEGIKEQWSNPEAEVGRFPAFKETELLVVEPERNVSEAEGVEVCLPPPHETQGEDDDNTVSEAIFLLQFSHFPPLSPSVCLKMR